jgi:hypothetical protein
MVIGLTSHFYLRRYHANFFRDYNYLFGAAIDGGSQIFVFLYSFSVGGAAGNETPFPNWAMNPKGNPGGQTRCTGQAMRILIVLSSDYCMNTTCIHGGPNC